MVRLTKKRTTLLTLILSGCAVISLYRRYECQKNANDATSWSQGFVVDTEGCRVPDIDPFDASIQHLITKTGPLVCNATPALTHVDKEFIRINRTTLKLFYRNDLDYCQYEEISRDEATDDRYHYGDIKVTFKEDVKVTREFVRVVCYGSEGDMIYTNFHAFILIKSKVEDRCDKQFDAFLKRDSPSEVYNLLIMGIDSVSRLNFLRQMDRTYNYLIDDLQAIELKGYTKVADNTFVNLVPMFAGKFVKDLPWDESFPEKYFDDFAFTWKNYSSNGFRTLFAEDAPQISIFNYAKEGFQNPPSDYYIRPFSLAMEEHGSIWRNNHDCVGPKLETQVVLDWVRDFVFTFKKKPFYAFSFLTRLAHDHINKAGAADEPYLNFFKDLNHQGVFNNTILIFFSDHGMRFGAIRQTYIGKIEERMPFMFLAFPKTFYEKYPELHANLKINQNRLTTPFDIYATLVDLLNFKGSSNDHSFSGTRRGVSLLEEVTPERTCESASIASHWCTCHTQRPMSTDKPVIRQAAEAAVSAINDLLSLHQNLCAELILNKVIDAMLIVENQQKYKAYYGLLPTITDYLLTFETIPGEAHFEVTVRHHGGAFDILGEISRINEYGDQSTCIKSHKEKKFCYCS